jgi:chromosome segregation ATPase
MRKEQEDSFDPTKPTLVVTYGTTRHKYRPLIGDVVVLGRSQNCDIGIVSPEIAPIHCLIFRSQGSWRIRDCSGRATILNGRPIQDESLHDGDVIQVGTFSFQAHLPGSAVPPVAPASEAPVPQIDLAKLQRLQQSRRRLIESALNMRRQLRDKEAECKQLTRELDDLRQLEQRLRKEHQAQKKRPTDQGTELRPTGKTEQELLDWEHGLEKRAAELDAYARYLLRQREKDQQILQTEREALEADRLESEVDLVSQRRELAREQERLALWQADLQHRQLELERQAILEQQDLARKVAQLQQEREEFGRQKEALASEQQQLEQERLAIYRDRAELRKLREELSAGTEVALGQSTRDNRLQGAQAVQNRLESVRQRIRQLNLQRRSTGDTISDGG